MTGERNAGEPSEVLFEFIAVGASVKVVAVDAVTGTEVAVVGPASAGRHALEQLAVRKLRYVLDKRKSGDA